VEAFPKCAQANIKEEPLSVIGQLSFVDRYLSVWIIAVMVIGVVVGFYSPETQEGLNRIEVVR
jgi:ACR3 family arsenite efflux pump ArsB